MTAETSTDDRCPRCGAHMQATHHPLRQARDGTPTEIEDEAVRAALAKILRAQFAVAGTKIKEDPET